MIRMRSLASAGRQGIFLSNILIVLLALLSNCEPEECLTYVGTEGRPGLLAGLTAEACPTMAVGTVSEKVSEKVFLLDRLELFFE